MAKARGDFTDILIRKKIIGPDQLSDAENTASAQGLKLQDAIIKLNYATPAEVMNAVAEQHGMQFIDLAEMQIPKAVIELVPESVARENVVIPLSLEGNTLKIITADPTNYDTIQKLQFILNKDIVPILAIQEQITEAINRNYGQSETESVDSMLVEFTDTAIEFTQTESLSSLAAADDSDAPVVRLCNLIIQEAVNLRASDIHIEPFADRVRVRYRIDGVLVERDAAPRRLLAPLLSRLKIMGSIDIS
jgi:type IV pilus assembly protein PilB